MAIKNRVSAANKSTSTHDGNNTDVKVEQGDTKLENNQESMMLIDPEDLEGGSTHSDKPIKVKASAEDTEDTEGTDTEDTDFNEGDDEEVVADFEDTGIDTDDGSDFGGNTVESPDTGAIDTEEPDWDAQPPADDFGAEDTDTDNVEDEFSTEADADADESNIVDAPQGDMSLLDVDGTDDGDISNVAFASIGTNVLVIKADRIIAKMTKRIAASTNKQDIYLTDQFHQVVASEMNKLGLRAALKATGFALAKVNVSSQTVLEARIKTEVTKTTAAVRRVQASKEAAFTQSLAIAAVGINRNFFKDVSNELKASLETELVAAGVRNPNRILNRAFASSGPAYAKALVTLATKISAMPEENRNSYVEALDMTSENPDSDFEDPNESQEVYGDDADQDMEIGDEDFETPVSASLTSLGVPTRKQVQASVNASVSVTASAILNGSQSLF